MRPGGLEPPTSWSVARRSIQLSYGRIQLRSNWVGRPTSPPYPTLLAREIWMQLKAGKAMRGGVHEVRRTQHRPQPNAEMRQRPPPKVPTTGLEPVRRFRHWSLKPACLPIPARGRSTNRSRYDRPMPERPRACSRRDSNPHGVNPHRVLNPARLPIPPPEPCTVRWSRGESNPRPLECHSSALPTELRPLRTTREARNPARAPDLDLSINDCSHCVRPAGLTRLELATSGVTDRHSNRLSYSPLVLLHCYR